VQISLGTEGVDGKSIFAELGSLHKLAQYAEVLFSAAHGVVMTSLRGSNQLLGLALARIDPPSFLFGRAFN
jgi:hypothetical protein